MGSSPGPPEPPDERLAVAERRSRALEEPLDIRLLSREPYPALSVRNPLHGTDYEARFPTFPDRSVAFCTCSDFARRGLGTCKHLEAAGRWLERHPTAPPARPPPAFDSDRFWAEADRRLARVDDPARPASLAWRMPGGLLVSLGIRRPRTEKKVEEEGVGRGSRGRPTRTSRARP